MTFRKSNYSDMMGASNKTRWIQVLATMVIWCALVLGLILVYLIHDLPDVDADLAAISRRPAVTVLDAHGLEIARSGDFFGAVVTVSELPPWTVQAVLAIEDRRFFEHSGLDFWGLVRALGVNLFRGRVAQGGSTITQQLAKILFLTPEQTLKRKVQEAILAFQLESRYSKEQILTAYFNRTYFGAGAYGIDAAARTYFGHSATRLDLYESALLAGLLKAPSRLSPRSNPDAAQQRAQVVLGAMVDAGFLSKDHANVSQQGLGSGQSAYNAAHNYFSDYVRAEISDILGEIDQDLTVWTTLDTAIQEQAASVLQQELDAAEQREGEAPIGQGAVVVLSPKGAIRAMVGGRSYWQSQFNRVTQAKRQPGSAFKPLVYLSALEAGFTMDSRVEDAPISIAGWQPHNYKDEYLGDIALHEALAKSVNTVAVRLLRQVGVGNCLRTARKLGIASDMPKDLSLALGAGALSPIELANVYASFANGGEAVIPFAIERITDREGNVLYQRQGSGLGQVISAGVLGQLNTMLAEAMSEGTGKSAQLGDRPAAGKTGTSQDFRDAWFAGFTADYVGVVWLGNDDGTPMQREYGGGVTGGSLPAHVWRQVMESAHQGRPLRALPGQKPQRKPALMFWARDEAAPEGESIAAATDVAVQAQDKPQKRERGGFSRFISRIVGAD